MSRLKVKIHPIGGYFLVGEQAVWDLNASKQERVTVKMREEVDEERPFTSIYVANLPFQNDDLPFIYD